MTKSRADIRRQKKRGRGGARPGAGRPAGSPRKRLGHQVLVRLNDADQRAIDKVLAAYPEGARPAVATYLREAVRSEVVPPRPLRVIWNADVLIDSSVFGQAALGPGLYRRLALFAHRLTARREYGKVWVPWTTLQEMAATPDPRRREVLGVLLNLYRELGDRIVLTGELEDVVAGEWATPPHFPSASIGKLEDQLLACIRGSGAGTELDKMGRDFGAWRLEQRAQREELFRKWTARYRADQMMRDAIGAALNRARRPADLYDFCDDLAGQLIKDYARRDPREGLKLAKEEPEKYLATWTFPLLVRVAQFALTVPPKERSAGSFGAYAKLLKSDENDILDATLAAVGARCGFLITQDGGLRERINFLFTRNLGRLQAFEFSDIEANWYPPNGHKEGMAGWARKRLARRNMKLAECLQPLWSLVDAELGERERQEYKRQRRLPGLVEYKFDLSGVHWEGGIYHWTKGHPRIFLWRTIETLPTIREEPDCFTQPEEDTCTLAHEYGHFLSNPLSTYDEYYEDLRNGHLRKGAERIILNEETRAWELGWQTLVGLGCTQRDMFETCRARSLKTYRDGLAALSSKTRPSRSGRTSAKRSPRGTRKTTRRK